MTDTDTHAQEYNDFIRRTLALKERCRRLEAEQDRIEADVQEYRRISDEGLRDLDPELFPELHALTSRQIEMKKCGPLQRWLLQGALVTLRECVALDALCSELAATLEPDEASGCEHHGWEADFSIDTAPYILLFLQQTRAHLATLAARRAATPPSDPDGETRRRREEGRRKAEQDFFGNW